MLARGGAFTKSTRFDLDLLPYWTLNGYWRERAGLMDAKNFDAMAVDRMHLVIINRNHFMLDTTWGVWKRHWTGLCQWCVETLAEARFANVPFVWCEQRQPFHRSLRDVSDANVEIAVVDLELQSCFFEKPSTNMYLVRGGRIGQGL